MNGRSLVSLPALLLLATTLLAPQDEIHFQPREDLVLTKTFSMTTERESYMSSERSDSTSTSSSERSLVVTDAERALIGAAADLIADRDRAREYHFKRFFDMDNPEDVHQFHICINTSEIDFEYATGMVIRAAEGLASGPLRTGVTSGV